MPELASHKERKSRKTPKIVVVKRPYKLRTIKSKIPGGSIEIRLNKLTVLEDRLSLIIAAKIRINVPSVRNEIGLNKIVI